MVTQMNDRQRLMGIRNYIKPTEKRRKENASRAIKLRQKKQRLGTDCFWTSAGEPDYEDTDVLLDL